SVSQQCDKGACLVFFVLLFRLQIAKSHIILTDITVLNKLHGSQVYTSNDQLGGIKVMAKSGMCHLVVPDEFTAIQQMVNWLSFVPLKRGARLPLLRQPVPTSICAGGVDPIDRPVEYIPSRERTNDDPRWMFTGVLSGQFESTLDDDDILEASTEKDQQWLSGFFDWGSWQELHGSWATGVIVGRARLGGIPCGVITPETRVSVNQVPADPSDPVSKEQSIKRYGRVWYADTSYKTAQTIADFAREELPLFVFANWRGISGGLKDMYEQILKFSTMIVEELITYPCPVFVYLPPHAELRGGAWVIFDPAINPDHVELFCAPDTCRGGVMAPEGTVEMKFGAADLVTTMHRLDDVCKSHLLDLHISKAGPFYLSAFAQLVNDRLEERHEKLLPIYQKVALQFADLHDTPGRLMARGLVSACVEWRSSRAFFFALLARRLLEQEAVKCLQQAKIPTVMATKQADCESCPLSQAIDDVPAAKLLEGIVPTLSAKASVDVPTESSEEIQLLNSAEAACQIIAETEAQRSASIRRDLSHLRQWFIEDSRHLSAEAAAQAWEQRHVTVAHWLATQLKHEQLREALSGLRDLQLDSESSVWKLAETTAAHGDSTEEQPTTSGSLPFILPRLDDMKKDQIVNHISQFLEQHPDCVDRLLNSFRGLQVARSDPVTATDPQGSTSSSEAAADTETTHRDC
uniref:Carboxyl_trans domain-containing protein n=1 Tax=Mesocestoides corti TaxID=53468 RepID=A0A5K3FW46_MESCO